mgnify:CR=1 FL=1
MLRYLIICTTLFVFYGCAVTKSTNEYKIEFKTYYVTHDMKCRVVNGVILGLDIDFEFSGVVVESNQVKGALVHLPTSANAKQPYKKIYNIYFLDPTTCKYSFEGKTDSIGHFSINLRSKVKILAFSKKMLSDDTDEYCTCIILTTKSKE